MKILICTSAAVVLGIVLGCVLYVRSIRRRNRGGAKLKSETAKRVVWVCLINGFAWVWCSYILAYLDRVQIAESLSQIAVTEIIGVVLAYCIKSTIENLSKNNRWPDKEAVDESEPSDAG